MVLIDLNEPPLDENGRLEVGIGAGSGDAGRGHDFQGLARAVLAGVRETVVRRTGMADVGVGSSSPGRCPSRLGMSGRGMTVRWSAGQGRGPALGLTGRGRSVVHGAERGAGHGLSNGDGDEAAGHIISGRLCGPRLRIWVTHRISGGLRLRVWITRISTAACVSMSWPTTRNSPAVPWAAPTAAIQSAISSVRGGKE